MIEQAAPANRCSRFPFDLQAEDRRLGLERRESVLLWTRRWKWHNAAAIPRRCVKRQSRTLMNLTERAVLNTFKALLQHRRVSEYVRPMLASQDQEAEE